MARRDRTDNREYKPTVNPLHGLLCRSRKCNRTCRGSLIANVILPLIGTWSSSMTGFRLDLCTRLLAGNTATGTPTVFPSSDYEQQMRAICGKWSQIPGGAQIRNARLQIWGKDITQRARRNPAWLADPCQYPSLNRSSSITPEPRATPTNLLHLSRLQPLSAPHQVRRLERQTRQAGDQSIRNPRPTEHGDQTTSSSNSPTRTVRTMWLGI